MSEIIVEGYRIETNDIWDIVDIEADKKMFLNREAGFIIKLIGNQQIKIGEKIPYESYPREISAIKDKWKILQNSVYEKWQADKSDIAVFKI